MLWVFRVLRGLDMPAFFAAVYPVLAIAFVALLAAFDMDLVTAFRFSASFLLFSAACFIALLAAAIPFSHSFFLFAIMVS